MQKRNIQKVFLVNIFRFGIDRWVRYTGSSFIRRIGAVHFNSCSLQVNEGLTDTMSWKDSYKSIFVFSLVFLFCFQTSASQNLRINLDLFGFSQKKLSGNS